MSHQKVRWWRMPTCGVTREIVLPHVKILRPTVCAESITRVKTAALFTPRHVETLSNTYSTPRRPSQNSEAPLVDGYFAAFPVTAASVTRRVMTLVFSNIFVVSDPCVVTELSLHKRRALNGDRLTVDYKTTLVRDVTARQPLVRCWCPRTSPQSPTMLHFCNSEIYTLVCLPYTITASGKPP